MIENGLKGKPSGSIACTGKQQKTMSKSNA